MTDILVLSDGKYAVHFDNGKLFATRNGETWRDLSGDKLIHSMMCECMNAQSQRDILLNALQGLLWKYGESVHDVAHSAILKATGDKL